MGKSKIKTIKKPKLKTQTIYEELAERTGAPVATVNKIMTAYKDMIEESLINMVEIPLAGIGKFTFTVVPPYERVEWNGLYKNQRVVYYKNHTDGYVKIGWHFGPSFRKKIKDATAIPYGSMPALPPNIEYRPCSNIKLDYNLIQKELLYNKIKNSNDENDDYDDDLDKDKQIENEDVNNDSR